MLLNNNDYRKQIVLLLFCISIIFIFTGFLLRNKNTSKPEIINLTEPAPSPNITSQDTLKIQSPELAASIERGWIQTTDSNGELAINLRGEKIDPNPPSAPAGSIHIKKPQGEWHLSASRIIVFESNEGTIFRPRGSLEEGKLEGNVVLKMFKKENISTQKPIMTMHTSFVTFEHKIGEIKCPEKVVVEGEFGEIVGTNLVLRLNDLDERIEYMRLKNVDYVKLSNASALAAIIPEELNSGSKFILASKNKFRKNINVTWYNLAFNKNVRAIQGENNNEKFATGDTLNAIFSSENKIGQNNPKVSEIRPPSFGGTLASFITSAIANTLHTSPIDNTVTILCDGPMEMTPNFRKSVQNLNTSETRLELIGQPAYLRDESDKREIRGDVVSWEINSQIAEIKNYGSQASELIDPMFRLQSKKVNLDLINGTALASGAGRLITLDKEIDPEKSRINAPLAIPSEDSESEDVRLKANWTKGVNLIFHENANGKRLLDQAVFEGDVELIDQNGTLYCQNLSVTFIQNSNGESIPSFAVATGGTKASTPEQILWANSITVTFTESTSKSIENTNQNLFGSGKVEASKLLAEGNVEIMQLSDGSRAWADKLEGDAGRQYAVLSGKEVTVINGRMLIDHGTKVELEQKEGTARWIGAGEAKFLLNPLPINNKDRINAKSLFKDIKKDQTIKTTMRAKWEDNMIIDQNFKNGSGKVNLNGSVLLRSQPSSTERSRLRSESLLLEFEKIQNITTQDLLPNNKKRRLRKIVATGNAELERYKWKNQDRSDEPIIHFLSGNIINYDDITFETHVPGEGSLLWRNLNDKRTSSSSRPFSQNGTGRLTWSQNLDLVQLDSFNWSFDASGNTELVHQALDETVSTLTASRIHGVAKRTILNSSTNTNLRSELKIGSPLEMRRVMAEGNVFLSTVSRRVDGHLLDYDLRNGIARISGSKGAKVIVETNETDRPILASAIRWNLNPNIDTITILDGEFQR